MNAAAHGLGMSVDALTAALERINRLLYAHRQQRPAPLRDDKILTAWNGLTISAFARGGFALDEPEYIERACRAANFIGQTMMAGDRLHRSYMDGVASGNGFLEDYVCFTAALLDLFRVTADPDWLTRAMALDRVLADRFEDRQNGGFFMTADDHEEMIAREKPYLDGAVSSGNAVALMNLLRLNGLTLDPVYRRRSEKGLAAFSAIMQANPAAFGEMLQALDDFYHPPRQIIAVTGEGVDDNRIARRLKKTYLPGDLVMILTQPQAAGLSRISAIFNEKATADGKAAVYICRYGACELPIPDEKILEQQLG